MKILSLCLPVWWNTVCPPRSGMRLCITEKKGVWQRPILAFLFFLCQQVSYNTLPFFHFTLHEPPRAYPQLPSTAHSTIAETGLGCLILQQVKARPSLSQSPTRTLSPSSTLSHNLRHTLFLQYSSQYWGIRAQRSPFRESAKLLPLGLF